MTAKKKGKSNAKLQEAIAKDKAEKTEKVVAEDTVKTEVEKVDAPRDEVAGGAAEAEEAEAVVVDETEVSDDEEAGEIVESAEEDADEAEAESEENEKTEKEDMSKKDNKVVEAVEKAEKKVETKTKNASPLKGFFAKKYDANENILTIFKDSRIYGALLGELFGTFFIALLYMTISFYGLLLLNVYAALALVGLTIAMYRISGSNFNPIVTAGLMATRRMSVIRGVLYMIAQILGSWIALLVLNGFRLAGGAASDLAAMAEIADGGFLSVAFVEFLGAIIIGFAFCRAYAYRKKPATFALVAAGGVIAAILVAHIISAVFLSLSENFLMNPAIALMYQIIPTTGESFVEILLGIAQGLGAYVAFPMIGGVIGFFASDLTSKLAVEE